MIRSKFFKKCSSLERVALLVTIFIFVSQIPTSSGFLSFSEHALNCSQYCSCNDQGIAILMRDYYQKHAELLGDKYRTLYDDGSSSDYVGFLGYALTVLNKIVEITCVIGDGKQHKVSSLLNGIDSHRYTSLEVKCRLNEELIWDVPTWQTYVNMFSSENCRLVPYVATRGIVLPMNLWILEVYRGGDRLIDMLDVRYTMNTVAFVLAESSATSIPVAWTGKFMLSASTISLHNNNLKTYECQILLAKHLDTLNLGGNELTQFPECLMNPDNIRVTYLSLAHNLISDLTAMYEVHDFGESPDISIIDLSHNEIRSLETLRAMPHLTTLDLSYNFIRTVNGDALFLLDNLEWFSLSHNRIHTLGEKAFRQNTALFMLDLSHNTLTSLTPNQFPAKTSPLDLDLRRNKLRYPPFYDCANKTLLAMNLRLLAAGNPYNCDCKAMTFEKCIEWMESSEGNMSFVESVFMDIKYFQCSTPKSTKGKALSDMSFHSLCIQEEDCPPGCSCFILRTTTMLVNCSGQHLMEMPDTIPLKPNNSIILYLDHNPLQMLCYRSYLRLLSELHIHNCLLTTVTPAAIAALQNVRVLTLHNNLLQKLPSSTRNMTLNNASNVTLHNNRWACSCDNLWLPRWIARHRSVLWTPGRIVCSYLRKPVEQFTDTDVNCSNSSYLDVVLAACLGLSTVVSTLVIVFYYRTEINQLIYSKLGLRFCNTFNYGDMFSPYDAFVSYSQDNYKWIVDTLIPRLEGGTNRYRLCLHFRDFPAGEAIVDNIPWAIRLSRCSILVLSKDFLAKEWCILELRAAFQRLLLMANRLIIIAAADIQLDDLTTDLRAYMSTNEYLRVGEPNFWKKLELFLPPPRNYPNAGTDVSSEAGTVAGAGGDFNKTVVKEYYNVMEREPSGLQLNRTPSGSTHMMSPSDLPSPD